MPYKNILTEGNTHIKQYIGVDLQSSEYHNQVKPDYYWDGKTIPLADESVDFVIATEFLEHYFDTGHIVKEIKRVLRPGGVFFFTVPSLWPIHEAPYDYHRFTPFTLREHFKIAGFSASIIKPLGGAHYHFALSLGLWSDFKLSKRKQIILKPFLRRIILSLLKKDYAEETFGNGQLYSGLYGFITN
jgi:SAM-dependent methyltransferase